MKETIMESLFIDDYIYSPLIYKLLKEGKLDHYISKLEKSNKYIVSNKRKIEHYKHFIMMIDNFIDYLTCSLNLNNIYLLNILECIFKDIKNPIFLTENNLKENYKLNKRTTEYKKIILDIFRKNLEFVIMNINNPCSVDIYNDKDLFNFLIDCCTIRKNHQYILFDDFNEYLDNPKKAEFYLLMWKILFQKLYEYYDDNDLIA